MTCLVAEAKYVKKTGINEKKHSRSSLQDEVNSSFHDLLLCLTNLLREVLRLRWSLRLSDHQIAESCKLSRSTVWEYIRRAEEAKLSWPLPEDLDDGD